jgi:hypothetical protein
MRKLASGWLVAKDDPSAGVAFEKIVYLHCGATLLQAEIRIGLGLIAVDADLTDIHVHHAHVDGAVAGQMIPNGFGNRIVIVLIGWADGSRRGTGAIVNR